MRKRLCASRNRVALPSCLPLARSSVEQRRIIGRLDHHAYVRMVLCRGADQGGTADVDILDRIVERAARPGNGLPKRIEIDHDQIDRGNCVLGERGHVLERIAARENRAMDLGMQGLHTRRRASRESRCNRRLR